MGKYPLDKFSKRDLKQWEMRAELEKEYERRLHFSLEGQRFAHQNALKRALIAAVKPFSFKAWRRTVDHQFSNHPLSGRGSLVNAPGGRFNIGDIAPDRIPAFPGIYLTQNFGTAIAERTGMDVDQVKDGLTSKELGLALPSMLTVRVRGHIEKTLDISSDRALAAFTRVIKKFTLSKKVIQLARVLKLAKPTLIATPQGLRKSLLETNWRYRPQVFDLPSNSQIFGQLCHWAGVEAVKYPSTKGTGNCLVVFPRNIVEGVSYMELEEKAPKQTRAIRLDSNTKKEFE